MKKRAEHFHSLALYIKLDTNTLESLAFAAVHGNLHYEKLIIPISSLEFTEVGAIRKK